MIEHLGRWAENGRVEECRLQHFEQSCISTQSAGRWRRRPLRPPARPRPARTKPGSNATVPCRLPLHDRPDKCLDGLLAPLPACQLRASGGGAGRRAGASPGAASTWHCSAACFRPPTMEDGYYESSSFRDVHTLRAAPTRQPVTAAAIGREGPSLLLHALEPVLASSRGTL